MFWLLRDFGLRVVNLFDTYHASKVLGQWLSIALASILIMFQNFLLTPSRL